MSKSRMSYMSVRKKKAEISALCEAATWASGVRVTAGVESKLSGEVKDT